MTSNPDTPAHAIPGEAGPPGLRDGDIISLGSQRVPDARGGRPLTMHWQIKVASGQHGRLLAREQAAAVREVLAWIARERSPDDEPDDNAGND